MKEWIDQGDANMFDGGSLRRERVLNIYDIYQVKFPFLFWAKPSVAQKPCRIEFCQSTLSKANVLCVKVGPKLQNTNTDRPKTSPERLTQSLANRIKYIWQVMKWNTGADVLLWLFPHLKVCAERIKAVSYSVWLQAFEPSWYRPNCLSKRHFHQIFENFAGTWQVVLQLHTA